MTFSNPTKTRWLIIILIAFNVLLLSVLFSERRTKHRMPDTVGLFKRELNLNDQQAGQFRELRKVYFEQSRPLRENLRTGREKMIETLIGTPIDTLAYQQLSAKNAATQTQLDELLANHFLELKTICNPEQQEKFKDAFLKAMHAPKGRMQKQR